MGLGSPGKAGPAGLVAARCGLAGVVWRGESGLVLVGPVGAGAASRVMVGSGLVR